MNKRAAIEATKATALTMVVLFIFAVVVLLLRFLFVHHAAWGLFLFASVFVVGLWWMVYRDESR